ncbi:MAG: DEAD/DEAH box helicase [Nanoarchaeota archaeon]
MVFKKLGLSDELSLTLKNQGFEGPREIQEKAIPLAMQGKDIIAGSATGSGKTLAFGASIIDKAERGKGIQALVLTPTRELAEQVADSIHKFAKHKKLFVVAIYGGAGINPQINDLQDADIVVGTPGRILDHLERRTLDLRHVKTLVLDEADRMLDMGFIYDVTKIIKLCPEQRQTMLFSATISPDIEHLVKKYMNSPTYIAIEQYVDPTKLKQVYYDVPQDEKFSLLVHLLKKEHPGLIMIFCNTQRNTDFVANNLQKQGIDAIPIHGGLSQSKRNYVMEKFKAERISVLVCTDVAARGLDIKNVSHVYNYDLPSSSKDYIHRIGRTARAGEDGIAINIVSVRDYDNFRDVLRDPEIKIDKVEMPTDMEKIFVNFRRDDQESSGHGGYGRRFGRPSSGGRRFGGDRPRSGGYGGGERRSGGSSGGKSFGRDSRGGGRGYSSRGGESSSRGRSFGGNRSFGGSRGGGRRF